MKKIIILLMLIGVPSNIIFGAAGNSSANFLLIDRGAANVGIGGIPNYFSKNIDLLYYNPSMVSYFKHAGASFSYSRFIEGGSFLTFSAVLPTAFFGVYSLDISGIFFSDIKGTIFSGFDYEYLGSSIFAGDMMIGFNYAYPISELVAAGAKIKLLTGALDNEKYADFAFDLGIILNFFSKRLFAGLSIKNIGPGVRYDKRSSKLPMLLDISSGFKILDNLKKSHTLSIFTALLIPFFEEMKWRIGIEYSYNEMMFVRIGYRLGYDTSKFTLGTGFNFKTARNVYKIDYGFILNSYIGSTHIVSVQFSYDMFPGADSIIDIKKTRPGKKELFKSYFDKALDFYKKGNYKNALKNINKALSLNPDSQEAAQLKSEIEAGKIHTEIEKFDKVVDSEKEKVKIEKKEELDFLFCTHCGKKLPARDAMFCPYCGKKLK